VRCSFLPERLVLLGTRCGLGAFVFALLLLQGLLRVPFWMLGSALGAKPVHLVRRHMVLRKKLQLLLVQRFEMQSVSSTTAALAEVRSANLI